MSTKSSIASTSHKQVFFFKTKDIGEKDLAVLVFLYEWGRPIRVGDMKKYLKYPHSTLNSVIKRLQKKKLVEWTKYGQVNLLPEGTKIAAHHLKHHEILEKFFIQVLGLPAEEAHQNAVRAIGCLSCETIRKMEDLIKGNLEIPCGARVFVSEKQY